MRLELAVHDTCAEALGDGVLYGAGRFAETRRVARFDLVAEYCAMTVGDRRDTRRIRTTALGERDDLRRRGEPSAGEVARDGLFVVIPMGRACAEARRIVVEGLREIARTRNDERLVVRCRTVPRQLTIADDGESPHWASASCRFAA